MTGVQLDHIRRAIELIEGYVAVEVAQFRVQQGLGLPILPLEIAARDLRQVIGTKARIGVPA